ncbi:2-C-methyl-D-erythritol 2,4-cyclodiphosphate synthase [Immundisolibacter sp.]|jgi:2-C-methyl-D-erythritol 2,4-cyclodiphosphate synthase|uniref:2-C-methyl-D-erythritol 2,4-cyclodiphosphate synthase n=1 Tax=Immundisolibacter sp. TaxID=1934948 RepID=UPI0025BB3F3E|nr:2-C-methyl-D-erythritol 2,4-cyclodiphosphate synthase [Immundisolibacter sp.]
MRIGHGYDLHALAPARPLVLGGVQIPHSHGPIAHSDGDVLLHALADALLGAAALGDIGQHFPDTDPAYAGADSRLLLRRVVALVREAGYSVVNIDATVLAQRPKLAPHRDAMRANIAADLGLDIDAVSVKATTTEGLGPVGRGEAIAAHAVCLLARA